MFDTASSSDRAARKFFWAILLKDGEELIGSIDLWPDDGSQEQRGFWLAPEFHGRGLITEAAERVTEYAFAGQSGTITF